MKKDNFCYRINRIIIFAIVLAIFSAFSATTAHAYAISDTTLDQILEIPAEKEESIDVPILMYHHLDDDAYMDTIVTPETFESHIKALSDNGYTGVSFGELIDYVENGIELPEKPIVITFDDGYLSNYEFAYPILQKYKMKATMFVIGILVGKADYLDDSDEYPIIPHFYYEQATEMIESGLISIQSHSYDMHRYEEYEVMLGREYRYGILPLETETEEEYILNFQNDFELARVELELETDTKMTVYSYPYGEYTDLSEKLLRELGIKVTLTTNHGSNKIIKGDSDTLYLLKRYSINDMPAEELLEILEQ